MTVTTTSPVHPVVPQDDDQDERRQGRQIGALTVRQFIAALQDMSPDAFVVIQDPDDSGITPGYPLFSSIGGPNGWITVWQGDGKGREVQQLEHPVVFITTYFEGRWESGPPVPEPSENR